ncbi:hypothetical protein AB6A40_004465 [Gnathostoma spinigerum]|uniref:G-protein coupled receptors family 1 profile domain-containing protein n=1 Tax=Gnathostoma spinigerum TaxID=75299 RepID=A0ABD6EK03_9BILA
MMPDGSSSNITDYDDFDPCEVPPRVDRRWYLVAVVGTPLSLISVFSNLLIARALLSKKRGHFFFLGLLALSDSVISTGYVPVIAMDIIKNEIKALWLTRLWWWYIGPLLAVCHTLMTFSCYLIILATLERLLITEKSAWLKKWRCNRGLLATFMLGFATVVKGSAIFEVEIVKNANCTGLTEYEPALTPLVGTWLYGTVFRFYFRNIATVFLPFFLLAYLNVRIVHVLRRQQRAAAMFRFATSEHKHKTREATRLTVVVVFSYLLANILNVIITAWEYVDAKSTQTDDNFWIYETATDVVSVLFVFVCATRLAVYVIFNKEILVALLEILPFISVGRFTRPTISLQKTRKSPGGDIDRLIIIIAQRLLHQESSNRRSFVYNRSFNAKHEELYLSTDTVVGEEQQTLL